MGVTLERVQNKFACIIGELCSEPVVLSQFAIWLDLRLAEYKAKGAISLDCSGDNPEPSWLNGHRFLPKTSNTPGGRFGGIGPQNTQPGPGEMSWSRISAERSNSQSPSYDTMSQSMVKQEPLEHEDLGVFPISLHPHEMSEPRTPIRKRNAAETISSEQELLSSTKSRRLTPPHSSTSATDPTSNQSLMSIISSEMPESQSQTHDTVETVDLTDTDMNIIMSYEDKQAAATPSRGENSRASFTSQNSMTPGGDISSRADDSINTASSNAGPDDALSSRFDLVEDYLYPKNFPQRLTNQMIRSRIANTESKPSHTVMDMVKAVGTLERWLWNKFSENRQIEEIDPEDLDNYLAEFFYILRRPNRQRYEAASLSNYRHHLVRYLTEKNYPCSPSKSPIFSKSQRALLDARKAAPASNVLNMSNMYQ